MLELKSRQQRCSTKSWDCEKYSLGNPLRSILLNSAWRGKAPEINFNEVGCFGPQTTSYILCCLAVVVPLQCRYDVVPLRCWYVPSGNTGTKAATGITLHTATTGVAIRAKLFHRHYSGQPALLNWH